MSAPSDKQLKEAINVVFDKYDVDKSGTLDFSEVKNVISDAFKQIGTTRTVTNEDVKKLIGAVDKDNDFKITKSELLQIFKMLVNQK